MSFLLRACLTIGVLAFLALERMPAHAPTPASAAARVPPRVARAATDAPRASILTDAPRAPALTDAALDAVPNLRAALSGLPVEMRAKAGAMAGAMVRAEVATRLGAREPAPGR